MAKQKELTKVTKGRSEFNLVGKANVSDFTFKTDIESKKSDWVYNQLNLGVDCGINGVIYADMMGGYGADRENVLHVHGKKENDNGKIIDDFSSKFTVDWEDRLDEETHESIGDRCFITVGLEKDINDKVIYKKFLSQYDAIGYIKENLEKDMVINVKGNLKYQEYNGEMGVKKEITSIALSKSDDKDFKATFMQTLLLDEYSIGKVDKETRTVSIDSMIVGFAKEYNGEEVINMESGKKKIGYNLPLRKSFEIVVGEDKDKVSKMLKLFKVKAKKITELVIDGYFAKGDLNAVEVSEADIPDDIKELIELELIDKEEVLGKMAFANGGKKKERMVIKCPHIDMIENNGVKAPSIARVIDKYTEDDVNISLIMDRINPDKVGDSEEDINSLIDSEADDEDENDWLKDL